MNHNDQDRIDAYLRNEMNSEERIAFEKDLENDKELAADFRMTKDIVESLSSRQEKWAKMVKWDEELTKERGVTPVRSSHVMWWPIALGVAACAVILFFIFRPTNPSIESGESTSVLRGNMEYEEVDKLMNAHQYDKALFVIDSLENAYQSSNRENAQVPKDSISEEKEYEMKLTEQALYELQWRKINVLFKLSRNSDALKLLDTFRLEKGNYQHPADSLWHAINE